MTDYCECGCGAEVRGRFVSGHNLRILPRTPDHRAAIAKANLGRTHSQETKDKIRRARLGTSHSESSRAKMSSTRRGMRFNDERLERMSKRQSGEGNNGWKGDSVGYAGIHAWVRSRKTLSGKCSICGENPGAIPRRNGRDLPGTQWANLSGEYRRDLDDYAEMCIGCHRKHDRKEDGGP